ncbi:TPA: hypothetical protein GXZ34_04940 [bacterium]|nr:hypothetical protein [bacterium]
MITQNQYNVLRQPTRHLNIKIDLINENDIIVGSFEGIATDGQINLSGDSTYGRNGNMTMVFDKKYNILPSPESKIWFNKRVGVFIGLKNYFDEMVWFSMGRFAIDDVDLNFDKAEKTMSCSLQDYMAFLDGTLGGTLSHKTVIDEGTPINEAIRSALTGLGRVSIEDIKIGDMDLVLPYTIEKSSGSTVYELVSEIVQIYMGWTFFYDENGVFVVEKIRDKRNDPIVEVFDGTERDLTLNTQPTVNFSHTRNAIYVWGRQLDDGTQIKWVYRNKWSRNNYSELDGLTDKQKGDICHIASEDNSYVYDGSSWNLLDFKVVSQFSIEQIGEKIWTESVDTIFTEEQAMLKSEYELQQRSNMAEAINFSVVPLYYLKPLNKINIDIDDLIEGDYLIDSLSVPLDLSSSMSVTAKRLYY